MTLFEVPDFDGHRDESLWVFVKWLNEIEQFFDRRNFSYATRVRFAKRKLIGRAQDFWENLEYMRFVRQEPAITEWEDMKAKLQDEYLPQYFRAKYLPQSSCGHSQDRKDNFRHRNSQPIAQFEENKVNVHSVSSPTLSSAWWSHLEQHVENLRKIIQDKIKASQKETNNSEASHTRDISVEPPILSATVEVPDLKVQEEELIVEPKQQVFEDTQLDEVDKVVSFSSPIPHIEFIIPDKFSDAMEFKAPLFCILPTVVPELKQVFRVRLLLLQHYKTRGRVFSNQRSMMREPHKDYFILILFNFGVDYMFIFCLSI
jgi:hypothetical protein